MTNPNGKVQLVLQGGGTGVKLMDSPAGQFVWFCDQQTGDVLGMWSKDVRTAEDVRDHIQEHRKRFREARR